MKPLLSLLLLTLLVCSCTSEIQDNSPALQGVVDSTLFRSADSRAIFNDNGSLVIQGNSDAQTLSILINSPSSNNAQVQLGGDNPNANIASFTDEFGNVFSTASTNANGQVDYQINGDNTVSGTFNFVALRNGVQDTITVSQGFMFGVPVLSELGNDPDMSVNDSFTARVNSVIFNPTIIAASETGNSLQVIGQTQQASIGVVFPIDILPGMYEFEDVGATGSYNIIAEPDSFLTSNGSLTIIAHDTVNREISGNFVFSLGGFSITDGAFSVTY